MRGAGGRFAALLVIAMVVTAAAAFLYATTRMVGAKATAAPELGVSVTSTVVTTPTVPMTVVDASRSGVVQVVIADDSGENDDGATRFDPPVITLVLGLNSTVTWINQDSIPHSVVTASGFSSGDIAPGHAYTYTFTAAGTYSYYCGYYPIMSGVITVKSA